MSNPFTAMLDNKQLSKEVSEASFRDFVKEAWEIIEPETDLKWNWHLDAVTDHLQACFTREITKLIINIPPGNLKSTITSVMFPPWIWVHEPSCRFLTGSYGEKLATRDSIKSRRIIESEWYQNNWGSTYQLTSDMNTKTRYENDKTGYRIVVSTGSGATGERGDILLMDDAHNMKDVLAVSETTLDANLEWWDQAWSTRLNKGGVKILIMQRLHDRDIAGHELKKGGWEHLLLPQEYEPTRSRVTVLGFKDPRTVEDELLHPDMFDEQDRQQSKIDLGERGYAAQHQQRPSAKKGNLLKRDWWGYYRELPPIDTHEISLHSWDTAYKDKEQNDAWGFVYGTLARNRVYIRDYFRRKMEVPEGERTIKRVYFRDEPDGVLIEDKASGQSIVQFALDEQDEAEGHDISGAMIPVVPIQVIADKYARATAISPKCQAGYILLPDPETYPETRQWVDLFIEDMAKFPSGQYRDGVDAFTQLISYAWSNVVGVVADDDETDEDGSNVNIDKETNSNNTDTNSKTVAEQIRYSNSAVVEPECSVSDGNIVVVDSHRRGESSTPNSGIERVESDIAPPPEKVAAVKIPQPSTSPTYVSKNAENGVPINEDTQHDDSPAVDDNALTGRKPVKTKRHKKDSGNGRAQKNFQKKSEGDRPYTESELAFIRGDDEEFAGDGRMI